MINKTFNTVTTTSTTTSTITMFIATTYSTVTNNKQTLLLILTLYVKYMCYVTMSSRYIVSSTMNPAVQFNGYELNHINEDKTCENTRPGAERSNN